MHTHVGESCQNCITFNILRYISYLTLISPQVTIEYSDAMKYIVDN